MTLLAQEIGIAHVQDITELPWLQVFQLMEAASKEYGQEKIRKVFDNINNNSAMPVLHLDLLETSSASKYIDLDNCEGRLVFGIPHMVIGTYLFTQNRGKMLAHKHLHGIEYVYSIEGEYELEYDGKLYPTKLKPEGSIFLFSAKKQHAITLAVGDSGRLLMARYYPKHRWPKPVKEHFKS